MPGDIWAGGRQVQASHWCGEKESKTIILFGKTKLCLNASLHKKIPSFIMDLHTLFLLSRPLLGHSSGVTVCRNEEIWHLHLSWLLFMVTHSIWKSTSAFAQDKVRNLLKEMVTWVCWKWWFLSFNFHRWQWWLEPYGLPSGCRVQWKWDDLLVQPPHPLRGPNGRQSHCSLSYLS